MVPKPNYHIRQAYSPPVNFNLLGEVVYDYGDLSVLVDLDEFAVNPVEPQEGLSSTSHLAPKLSSESAIDFSIEGPDLHVPQGARGRHQ
jgi:hypothetical protein